MNYRNILKINSIILFSILISCEQKVSNSNDISGIWTQVGYGRLIEIQDSSYIYYNTSESSCLPLAEGELKDRFTVVKLDKDTLILNPGGIVDYQFHRTQELPRICSNDKQVFDNNPVVNFEEFWNTFNNNYAFFEERDIDWDKIYQQYHPRVDSIQSDRELYKLLDEISQKFQDGHIKLDVPDSLRIKTSKSPTNKPVYSKTQIQSDILDKYLLSPKEYNSGVLKWGTIRKNDIGYIQITDMNGFSNYVPNQNMNSENFESLYEQRASENSALQQFRDEIDGVDYIMPKVLEDLQGKKSIVIDIRFNGGGYETVALKLLSYFIPEQRHILSICAKTKMGHTRIQDYLLQPNENYYKGKIYLLTSGATASAAEIFVLGAKSYPEKITRIGSSTNGIFSEILWKKLPNNWEYSLSNEIYTDPSGNSFEIKGVFVDINMKYPENRSEFYDSFYKNDIFRDVTIEKIINIDE
jgi:hypothetical protein